MLVLTRKVGESIFIGEGIQLTVSAISGSRVKICINAPKECAIRRAEIAETAVPAKVTPVAAPGRIPAKAVAR